MMAWAKSRVAWTRTGAMQLGRIWRNSTRRLDSPCTMAASTYSFSRSLSTEARTRRAKFGV